MQRDKEKPAAQEREDSSPSDDLTGSERAEEHDQPGSGSSLRGVQHLKGVQDVGTALSRRMRAIPNREGHYYLDLYLLQKERDRLVQEGISVGKRRARVSRRLVGIQEEMVEKEQKAMEGMSIVTGEPAPDAGSRPKAPPRSKRKKYEYKEEEWQRMSMNY